jgi:hypothetical protein
MVRLAYGSNFLKTDNDFFENLQKGIRAAIWTTIIHVYLHAFDTTHAFEVSRPVENWNFLFAACDICRYVKSLRNKILPSRV